MFPVSDGVELEPVAKRKLFLGQAQALPQLSNVYVPQRNCRSSYSAICQFPPEIRDVAHLRHSQSNLTIVDKALYRTFSPQHGQAMLAKAEGRANCVEVIPVLLDAEA